MNERKKRVRLFIFIPIIIVIIVLVSLLRSGFGLGGPDPLRYGGQHPDLNTVATNSLSGIYEVYTNKIVVLSEDSFGRQLFGYWRSQTYVTNVFDNDNENWKYGLLVSQKTRQGFVYFYPGTNYIVYGSEGFPAKQDYESWDEYMINLSQNPDIADDIELLKERNDWEEPFDESKCVSVKVSHFTKYEEARREGLPAVAVEGSRGWIEQYIYLQDDDDYFISHLGSDKYERHIFIVRVWTGMRVKESGFTKSFLLLLFNDGRGDPINGVSEISNIKDYQTDLKEFKERNGWDKPPG